MFYKMENIIKKLRVELKRNSDEKTKKSSERFFKEKVVVYGVNSKTTSNICKQYFKEIKDLSKSEIFELCQTLWQSGNLEESFVACHWSYSICKRYEPNDFEVFEQWVNNFISNWASCDTFCNHTVGEFIEMYPDYLKELKRWAKSNNRWKRRASAVSLIVPAKKGLFLNDVFQIADILLTDKDDMVQKGYGWMLKVASNKHQQEVFDYVIKHKAIMPRTALRYAIEKMPPELKKQAMAK